MNDITWGDIYNDFCLRWPKLKERVLDYRPYAAWKILISLDHDSSIVYDFSTGMVQIVSNDIWKEL